MNIDIDKLTEAELVDLNRRVVERLRFLHQMRAHRQMLNFSIGERVGFQSEDGRAVTGVLIRYNKRSVTVIAEDGHRWNLSPSFLRKIETPAPQSSATNVIPLK